MDYGTAPGPTHNPIVSKYIGHWTQAQTCLPSVLGSQLSLAMVVAQWTALSPIHSTTVPRTPPPPHRASEIYSTSVAFKAKVIRQCSRTRALAQLAGHILEAGGLTRPSYLSNFRPGKSQSSRLLCTSLQQIDESYMVTVFCGSVASSVDVTLKFMHHFVLSKWNHFGE